jgi:hypothetical protein
MTPGSGSLVGFFALPFFNAASPAFRCGLVTPLLLRSLW